MSSAHAVQEKNISVAAASTNHHSPVDGMRFAVSTILPKKTLAGWYRQTAEHRGSANRSSDRPLNIGACLTAD